jgi:hypothetical protein
MDFIQQKPDTLTDAQLDSAIDWLAERGHALKAASFRREKLNRAYQVALTEAIVKDPHLVNTKTVVVYRDPL